MGNAETHALKQSEKIISERNSEAVHHASDTVLSLDEVRLHQIFTIERAAITTPPDNFASLPNGRLLNLAEKELFYFDPHTSDYTGELKVLKE